VFRTKLNNDSRWTLLLPAGYCQLGLGSASCRVALETDWKLDKWLNSKALIRKVREAERRHDCQLGKMDVKHKELIKVRCGRIHWEAVPFQSLDGAAATAGREPRARCLCSSTKVSTAHNPFLADVNPQDRLEHP
jgi:hypothetical protein